MNLNIPQKQFVSDIPNTSEIIGETKINSNTPLESERYSKDYFLPANGDLKMTKSPLSASNLHVFNNAIKVLTPSKDSSIEISINPWVDEKYEDGSSYLGEKFENRKNGRGFLTYPDGNKFDGEFEDDIISGYGKLYIKDDKLIYDGEWKNSVYHGNGTLYNIQIEDKSSILKKKENQEENTSEADTKNHLQSLNLNENLELKEKQEQSEEISIIKQESEKNLKDAREIRKSVVNRDENEGENSLKNMEIHGVNWIRYDGEFYQGKKHGLGTLFLKGGRKFTGMFCNDMIHGIGTFYFEDGHTLIGEWENDELITEL